MLNHLKQHYGSHRTGGHGGLDIARHIGPGLQHNAAHLGIATGTCLAEATTRYLPRIVGRAVLASAYLATIATVMAEVLGGAIALQMLFGLPVRAAASSWRQYRWRCS